MPPDTPYARRPSSQPSTHASILAATVLFWL